MAAARSGYAFGRSISPTRGQWLNSLDLRFTFEKKHMNDPTPYWQQGDEDLNRTLPSAQRAALRQDPRVIKELERFWDVFSAATVSKDEYLDVHDKFAAVLIPDLSPAEARESGEDDWVTDAAGAERMNKEQFMACLFELADMYGSRPLPSSSHSPRCVHARGWAHARCLHSSRQRTLGHPAAAHASAAPLAQVHHGHRRRRVRDVAAPPLRAHHRPHDAPR